jgi:hypothetical protein
MNRFLIAALPVFCFAVAACAPSSTLFQPSNSAMQAANPVPLTVGQRSDASGCAPNRIGGANCTDKRVFAVIAYDE